MAQGDPASTLQKALLDAMKHLEDRMDKWMLTMKCKLMEREHVNERLVKHMKLEKAPSF